MSAMGATTLADLTPRCREVLALLAQGHGDKQIARLLCVSINTVQTHTARIYDAIGRGDGRPRVAATLWYLRQGRTGDEGRDVLRDAHGDRPRAAD